ncbi:MAG: RsmE family RNA methyltransferase [Cyanobacteriota bacterium]|nr:RsmE family RNA methyltransferase [Cyanobacteriota bacterium]
MARERRRLLIPPGRLARRVALLPPERHYLTRVLRLVPGEGCDVVDGAGRRWGARLTAAGELALEQPLEAPAETRPAPAPTLELAVAVPRQEVELVWRMATELGIDRLQPLLAERCQRRERWPVERWRAIVREACEQSERLWLPELGEPQLAAAWLAAPEGNAPGAVRNLLATSRGDRRPLLPDGLVGLAGAGFGVRLAIGPEGGWSPAEEALALERGWMAVSAGPTILRTTTAAVAAAAWLTGWRESLSC